MAKTKQALTGPVHIVCPDGKSRVYGPGQVTEHRDVVAFLEKEITNPAAWTDPGDLEPDDDDGASDPIPEPEAPAGNASTEEWATYAADSGVTVPDGATRAQIVESVKAAGLPV